MFVSSFLLIFLFLTNHAYSLTAVSTNLENLFDAKDDPLTNDEAYLPKNHPSKKRCSQIKNPWYRRSCLHMDWTEEAVNLKIRQHQKALAPILEKAEIVSLIEIENMTLAKRLLSPLGFQKIVITEGGDERGVQVALGLKDSSGLKYLKHQQWTVGFSTRPLLEVHLKKKKRTLVVFVCHWPSQRSGVEKRLEVASLLRKRTLSLQSQHPDWGFLALGDFNTVEEDQPHPFSTVLYKDGLYRDGVSQLKGHLRGTYFFKPQMKWNLLDRAMVAGKLNVKSFSIYAPKHLTTHYEEGRPYSPFYRTRIFGLPWGYNHKAKTARKAGFSDHFPIMVSLEFNDK